MLTRSFCYTDTEGQARVYVDHKRVLWLLSVVYPLSPVFAVVLHAFSGNEWMLVLPILFSYGLVPLLDGVLGEDRSNPPEQTVPELENDRYYRMLTWMTVPLHIVSLVVATAWDSMQGLSLPAWLTLAVVAGLASGLAVNTAHEMGHKRTRIEQWLSRVALAVPAYGHFTVEHNFGHHKDVATCCSTSNATPTITPIPIEATSHYVISRIFRNCQAAISACSCSPTCRHCGSG